MKMTLTQRARAALRKTRLSVLRNRKAERAAIRAVDVRGDSGEALCLSVFPGGRAGMEARIDSDLRLWEAQNEYAAWKAGAARGVVPGR